MFEAPCYYQALGSPLNTKYITLYFTRAQGEREREGETSDHIYIQPIIRRVFGTTCSVKSGLSKSDYLGEIFSHWRLWSPEIFNNFLVFSADDHGNNGLPRAGRNSEGTQ